MALLGTEKVFPYWETIRGWEEEKERFYRFQIPKDQAEDKISGETMYGRNKRYNLFSENTKK